MRSIKTLLIALGLVVASATATFAQATAVKTSHFVWNMDEGASEASGFQYEVQINGQAPTTLGSVACATVNGQTECTAPIPPLQPGVYSAALFALGTVDGTLVRSEPSNQTDFKMIAIGTPFNFRVVNGTPNGGQP